MGFDCYTTDLVFQGPINVLKWAENVILPKDTAAVEGMSD